jgi:hypothetical protein
VFGRVEWNVEDSLHHALRFQRDGSWVVLCNMLLSRGDCRELQRPINVNLFVIECRENGVGVPLDNPFSCFS